MAVFKEGTHHLFFWTLSLLKTIVLLLFTCEFQHKFCLWQLFKDGNRQGILANFAMVNLINVNKYLTPIKYYFLVVDFL